MEGSKRGRVAGGASSATYRPNWVRGEVMSLENKVEILPISAAEVYVRICTLGDHLHKLPDPRNRYELTGKIIHSVSGGNFVIPFEEIVQYGIEDPMEVKSLIMFARQLTFALKRPQTIYKMIYTVARLLIDPWRYGHRDSIGIGASHIMHIFREEEELNGFKFQLIEPVG